MSDQSAASPESLLAELPPEKVPFARALIEAAFTTDEGRQVVHCQAGSLGSDWDLEHALEFLASADEVAWVDNMFRHDLAVLSDGKVRNFDVRRPEPSS